MDDMDRILAKQNHGADAPEGLAERVSARFHRRRRRRQALQTLASVAMVAAGVWLVLPWIAAFVGQVSLPQNGLVWLQSIASIPSTGFAVDSTIRNASYVQQSLSSSLAIPHWLGLLALSAGSLLGLGSLLPYKML